MARSERYPMVSGAPLGEIGGVTLVKEREVNGTSIVGHKNTESFFTAFAQGAEKGSLSSKLFIMPNILLQAGRNPLRGTKISFSDNYDTIHQFQILSNSSQFADANWTLDGIGSEFRASGLVEVDRFGNPRNIHHIYLPSDQHDPEAVARSEQEWTRDAAILDKRVTDRDDPEKWFLLHSVGRNNTTTVDVVNGDTHYVTQLFQTDGHYPLFRPREFIRNLKMYDGLTGVFPAVGFDQTQQFYLQVAQDPALSF